MTDDPRLELWLHALLADLRLAARGSGSDSREDVGFRIARNLQ